ncbi:peptidase S8/S53 domain-containing protein [Whalleya microplaca]|nr:peptidase S8/S53 domain-containing protein [Whalleya microplaca]
MFYENKGWITVDLSVHKAEALFRTHYFEIEDGNTVRLGCDEYYLPKYVSEHVDYITPGVKLSGPLSKKAIGYRGRKSKSRLRHRSLPSNEAWKLSSVAHNLSIELRDCALNFTPSCYRALYNIPSKNIALPGNSVGLFEIHDTFSQEDIDLFYAEYAPEIPQGTSPVPAYIDGAEAPVPQDSELNTGESNVDIDIISSLVYPQTITLYQTDYRAQSRGIWNSFLDALDGSYCNHSAYNITGDSPGIDPEYPDPRGYQGSRMCGSYKPAKVVSISYGSAEADLPKKYLQRQCNEWLKLGLQGHTFLIISGDNGVGGFAGDVSDSGCLSGSGQNQTIYTPDYPSACPYITSIGATQLQPNQTIKDPESALQTPRAPSPDPDYFYASGGGFSNYFPAPEYQKATVDSYFKSHDPGHPYYTANEDASNIGENGGVYNRGGRAYPDISAFGANFRAYTNGTNHHYFGTSLAAPLWAAVITLINQERQAVGKGSVGFINPVLYSHPWTLTDIKNGSNPNCGSSGFAAVDGWDPVTGLGTPKYERLLELFLSLS